MSITMVANRYEHSVGHARAGREEGKTVAWRDRHSDMHTVRSESRPTRCPCVPGHEIIGRVPANLLKNNRKERKMHTQPCFYRCLYSFQQALLQAVHWPPKPTKRRKRYFGLDLRVLSMGLPNFLPVMSV